MPAPSNPFSRPPNQAQDPRNGQTYMPPSIKRAMNEYDQNSAPGAAGPQVITPTQQPPAGPVTGAPPSAPSGTAPPDPGQAYDFITDPPAAPKQPLLSRLPGSGSMATRVALIAIIFIIFIIIIAVFKNISGKAAKADAAVLITVVQDQQEILHIANEINGAQNKLSANSQNFTATLGLSISTSQSKLLGYLTAGGQKIQTKALSLKISTATDNQLIAADTAGTLEQAYRQVMQTQLSTYGKDLQKAYAQDKGPKARAILNESYQQAQLLSTQLNSPTS